MSGRGDPFICTEHYTSSKWPQWNGDTGIIWQRIQSNYSEDTQEALREHR